MALRKRKFQVVFSLVVATAALLVTWVVLSDDSPFTDYVARHDMANMWRLTVFLPFVFSALITRNPHSPSTALFIVGLFLQWSLIGYVLSIPAAKLWYAGTSGVPRQNQ